MAGVDEMMEDQLLGGDDMVAVNFESDNEDGDEKKEAATEESTETGNDNGEGKMEESGANTEAEPKEGGEGENAEEKKGEGEEGDESTDKGKREEEITLLTQVVRGPVRMSVVLIKDLGNHDLQQILHRCTKASLEMEKRRGTLTLWFEPRRSVGALAVLRKLAKLKLAGEDFKMECPKPLASMLGSEKIKLKYPDGKSGHKNKTLYIHDIPNDTTEEVLRGLFPDVASVLMPCDIENGNKLGCAILDFKSGKDASAAIELNPEILIGETKCLVSPYFPAPEEDEQQKKSSTGSGGGWRKRQQNKKGKGANNNRGGNFKRRGYSAGGYGGGVSQERTNQMLMNQMQNLASMVMGGGGMGGGGGRSQGLMGAGPMMGRQGSWSDNQRYGGNSSSGGNFGNYQSGYFDDDDYGSPNKRRRGNFSGGNFSGSYGGGNNRNQMRNRQNKGGW